MLTMHTKFSINAAVRATEIYPDSFSGVGDQPERHSRPLGHIETMPAGCNIYMQDDPALSLFRVIDGTVGTFLVMENGSRRVTGFLYESDYFGPIFSDRHRFSAEAITDCTVVRYNRQMWTSRDVPDFAQSQIILEALRSERKTAEEHALLLGGLTTCAKLAGFLLHLSRRAAQRGETENPVAIPMTRYDIADFLGTTPESVSRCFTKLNRSGVIRMDTPDSVTLIDWRRLSNIPRGF